MSESNQKAVSAPAPIAAAAYYIITILLFPVSVAGYLLWSARLFCTEAALVCRGQPKGRFQRAGPSINSVPAKMR